jgi:hypothetical protein
MGKRLGRFLLHFLLTVVQVLMQVQLGGLILLEQAVAQL